MDWIEFQSTLPRGERPGRPATLVSMDNFNPRSREGSDHLPSLPGIPPGYFNPRSREGSDAFGQEPGKHGKDFNPRSREGSDTRMMSASITRMYFNPRSREGSDVQGKRIHDLDRRFQSTLPRGERLAFLCSMNSDAFYFNPRSREGSD